MFILNSVRNKFTVYLFVFCAIPYIVSSMYISKLIIEKTQENYINNAYEIMENVHFRIYEGFLQPSSEIVSLIAMDKNIAQLVDKIGDRIISGNIGADYRDSISHYFDIFNKIHNNPVVGLGTEQGGYMVYPGGFTLTDYDPRIRPWYQEALKKKGTPVVINPYIRVPNNDLMITIAQSIESKGETIGVIAFGCSADEVEFATRKHNLGNSGYMLVLNDKNKFIISPKHKEWLTKSPDEVNSSDLKILNAKSGGYYEINLDGKKQYMSVRVFDKSGWKIATIIDATELEEQEKQILIPCLIIFTVTFIFILLAIFQIVKQILTPINVLTEAVLAVSAGDLNIRTEIHRKDELGILAQKFNEMVGRLQSSFCKIENQNRELYRREKEFKTLVENAQDIILRLDANLNYIYINPVISIFTGKPSVYFIGKGLEEIEFPDEFISMVKQIQHSMSINMPTKNWEMEFEYTTVNEEKVWFQACIIPEIDIQEKANTILFVIRNITEHKNIEKYIARMDRLNTVGEMAAGIAHEIRNPMTTVRGFLQVMSRKEYYSKDKEFFTLMIDELDRANDIIKEYLSLAKNKNVKLEVKNINEIINTMLPLLDTDAIISNSKINVELSPVQDLALDEKDIRQLLINMVRNAIESMMPGGGVVTIKTYTSAGQVVMAIEDQGCGINKESMEKLGIPFVTTKENGIGLGLAVCYSVAARHKAKIEVQTGVTGTTFYIVFAENDINAEEG